MDAVLELLQQGGTIDTFLELGLGLIMPLIVSALKRENWPNTGKVLLSLAIAVIAATIITLVKGEATLGTIFDKSAVIFATATVFYKTYFQKSSVDNTLTALGTGKPALPA